MFEVKDYLEYFHQLYEVEIAMKKEGKMLLKYIDHPEAQVLIRKLIADEERHAKIVKEMIALVKK